MSFKHPYQDPRSERLLLVVLEQPAEYSREYRHIRATVVRRAVPHVYRKDAPAICDGTGVEIWNDDHVNKCSGYRVASYVFKGKSAIYVDDMQLRGQIDALHPRAMNEGKPYGNSIRFNPYEVNANIANAILGFFKKWEKFHSAPGLRYQDDSFYNSLDHLAQCLGITKVVFHKPGVRHCALSETNCFNEVDIAFAETRINELLAPFYQPKIS